MRYAKCEWIYWIRRFVLYGAVHILRIFSKKNFEEKISNKKSKFVFKALRTNMWTAPICIRSSICCFVLYFEMYRFVVLYLYCTVFTFVVLCLLWCFLYLLLSELCASFRIQIWTDYKTCLKTVFFQWISSQKINGSRKRAPFSLFSFISLFTKKIILKRRKK